MADFIETPNFAREEYALKYTFSAALDVLLNFLRLMSLLNPSIWLSLTITSACQIRQSRPSDIGLGSA